MTHTSSKYVFIGGIVTIVVAVAIGITVAAIGGKTKSVPSNNLSSVSPLPQFGIGGPEGSVNANPIVQPL